jgi:signal peptidase I
MFPTLSAGGRILGRRHAYASPSQVRRGDIVVFNRDVNGKRYQFIWRVVGLPEDNIAITGRDVLINGKPLTHEQVAVYGEDEGAIVRESDGSSSYLIALENNPKMPPPSVEMKVPTDQFFLLGDNRDAAMDSRYHGPVPFEAIVARKL